MNPKKCTYYPLLADQDKLELNYNSMKEVMESVLVSINKQKLKIITERISQLGFEFNLEDEKAKKIKSLLCAIKKDEEIYYYKDKNEHLHLIVTFNNKNSGYFYEDNIENIVLNYH